MKDRPVAEALDGLLTFFASHHAIRADKVLTRAGLSTELIPGPKELSPNCGVALRFRYEQRDEATSVLAENHVEVDEVHRYTPSSDSMPRTWRRRRRRSLR